MPYLLSCLELFGTLPFLLFYSLLYAVAWFGLALLPVVCEKCCFPLAEERIKRKTFFSHTSGSLGARVREV